RDKSPTVTHGVSEVSELAADLRLALPLWCDCFPPWKTQPPRALSVQIDVKPHTPQPVSAELELTNTSSADEVAACLKRKIEGMDVSALKAKELHLALPLYFLHSGVSEPLMGSPPNIQFLQFDAMRRRRAASVAERLGARAQAAATYDGLVQRFKLKR